MRPPGPSAWKRFFQAKRVCLEDPTRGRYCRAGRSAGVEEEPLLGREGGGGTAGREAGRLLQGRRRVKSRPILSQELKVSLETGILSQA